MFSFILNDNNLLLTIQLIVINTAKKRSLGLLIIIMRAHAGAMAMCI